MSLLQPAKPLGATDATATMITYPGAYAMVRPPGLAAVPRPRIRLGDAERGRACDDLSAHFAAGRISELELEDRLARAMESVYASDLAPLFADLPKVPRAPGSAAPRTPSSNVGNAIAISLAVGCAIIAFLMVIGAGLVGFAWVSIFAVFGGLIAALGGAGIGWALARRGGSA